MWHLWQKWEKTCTYFSVLWNGFVALDFILFKLEKKLSWTWEEFIWCCGSGGYSGSLFVYSSCFLIYRRKKMGDFLILLSLTRFSCSEATRSWRYVEDSFGSSKNPSLLICLNWTMYSFARDAELISVEEDTKIKSHSYMACLSHGKAP